LEIGRLEINAPENHERYSRQVLFKEIGAEGQKKLAQSSVVIVGCGATGSALASLLARSGVGTLRILDRDYVEPSNLQRQTLFDEERRARICAQGDRGGAANRALQLADCRRAPRCRPDSGERRFPARRLAT
jgi:molybdopterin/thiamine biosynthesis adenylyltransferase